MDNGAYFISKAVALHCSNDKYKNNAVVIIYKNGETETISFDSNKNAIKDNVKSILDNRKDITDIRFGKVINDSFSIYSKGENSLRWVFTDNNWNDKGNTAELQDIIKQDEQFKLGIYGEDKAGNQIGTGAFNEVFNPKESYIFNVQQFEGHTFSIDETKITNDIGAKEIDEYNKKVSEINKQLDKLGVERKIESLEEIESVLKEYNDKVLKEVNSDVFYMLKYENGEVKRVEINDPTMKITNRFGKENINELNNIYTKGKSQIFFVSLHNGNNRCLLYRNGELAYDLDLSKEFHEGFYDSIIDLIQSFGMFRDEYSNISNEEMNLYKSCFDQIINGNWAEESRAKFENTRGELSQKIRKLMRFEQKIKRENC